MKQKNRDRFISLIFFITFIQIIIFIFLDGIGGYANDGVSGFIEQANLKKSLGNWYQLVFWTVHVNLIVSLIGMFWFWANKYLIYKNVLFSFISFMLFCLFAILVFKWNAFTYNPYEAFKTLFLHLINPLIAFIVLFFIKKEIYLVWQYQFYSSIYVTFYFAMTIVIYYQFNFTIDASEELRGKPLWIYGFLDFNNAIFAIPTTNLIFRCFFVSFLFLLSPFVGMITFITIKFIFQIPSNSLTSLSPKKWFNLKSF